MQTEGAVNCAAFQTDHAIFPDRFKEMGAIVFKLPGRH